MAFAQLNQFKCMIKNKNSFYYYYYAWTNIQKKNLKKILLWLLQACVYVNEQNIRKQPLTRMLYTLVQYVNKIQG